MARPMLDDVELQQVQTIEVEGEQVLVQHGVPALEGDFVQRLDRRATRLTLTGVLTGADARDGLEKLRAKFRAAAPVPFVADIATATKVDKVLIEGLGVRELAGKTERFEYAFTLREFIPPPQPETVPPPPVPPPPPDPTVGTLIVEVEVEGQPEFDFSTVTVTVEGKQDDGTLLSRTLTTRENNVWTEENVPPGQYTAKAVVTDPQAMIGAADTQVRAGQTASPSIALSATSNIATTFVVHFRFNKAFIEPCMRAVLREVADFAKAHPDEKLLIVGHTDKVDTNEYNQSLSERRARSVFAYMTFGVDKASRDAALAEWNALRVKRPKGELPSIKDSWDVREYQHILQDLGFYPGAVDGDHGSLTNDAVRAFRCQHGLPPGTTVDDDVWSALIVAYLEQDNLAVPKSQFFPNCTGEILKWLGCGEEDPVKNVGTAWRPNRHTELMFVKAAALPCKVPQPDTFNKPEPGAVNKGWCLGPGDKNKHGCFVVPAVPPPNFKPSDDQFKRVPAQPGTLTVKGSIKNEDGTPRAEQKFVLISPIGEFKAAEQSSGEPQPALTGSGAKAGEFEFKGLPEGVYSLEVVAPANAPVLARLDEDPDTAIKGNNVCKALSLPADGTDPERLDVVIVKAPVLREIKLPVVVHLLTALNSSTRQPRPCVSAGGAPPVTQASTHTDAEIKAFFNAAADAAEPGANVIWRQARIRFEIADIVHQVYDNPARVECAVDNAEIGIFLQLCAYPNVVNVFFVMSFDDPQGNGEAGAGVSVESAAAQGLREPGCIVAQQARKTFAGVLVTDVMDTKKTVQVLAHELGHFLNLNHVDQPDLAANTDRLMLPGTLNGSNRRLTTDEIATTRASLGAAFECVRLSLKVTGATQVGGSRSHQFIFLRPQTPPAGPAPVVTVDAVISDQLLDPAVGALTMTGGSDGANDRQKIVTTAQVDTTPVTAVYTPVGGGNSVKARVEIFVSTFILTVTGQGPRQVSPDRKTFTFRRSSDPNAVVSIGARIQPLPFCVPTNMIIWQGATQQIDPLLATVPQNVIGLRLVSATVAGEQRTVTIRVVDLAFVRNVPPFDQPIDRVQIEGVLNRDRSSFDLGDLFSTQPNSLFCVKADFPGVPAGTNRLSATIRSPSGEAVPVGIDLIRQGNSDRFVSLPLLAIPAIVTSADLKLKEPQNLEVIRARAGGKIRVELQAPFSLAGLGIVEVTVRGRVVHIAAQAFTGSGTSAGTIRTHIATANRVWAQAGVEVRERSVNDAAVAPAQLLDLDTLSGRKPFTGALTAEERQLLRIDPNGPTRSANANDVNVYYVRSFVDPNPANGTPSVGGISYAAESFPVITEPDHTAIAILGTNMSDAVLAHELGHHFLRNWPGDEHSDTASPQNPWPLGNVMHFQDSARNVDVDRTQAENVINGTAANTHPLIRFEP